MLSSYTIILLKTIRAKPILANLGKPLGKPFKSSASVIWKPNDFFFKLLDLGFHMAKFVKC